MYATARIVLEAVDQAVTIPREAVTSQSGQRIAFKIDGDKLTATPVVEGLNDGRNVQIVVGAAVIGEDSGAPRVLAAHVW